MKILMLSHVPFDEYGGASRVYQLLAQGFKEQGHDVDLYHLDDFAIPTFLKWLIKRLLLPEWIHGFYRNKIKTRYSVVFCSNGTGHRLFQHLRTQNPRPILVHHVHGLSFFDYEALEMEKTRGHDRSFAISPWFKKWLPLRWEQRGEVLADLVVVQNLRDQDYILEQRSKFSRKLQGYSQITCIPAPLHPKIEAAQVIPQQDRPHLTLLWFGSWIERKGNRYVNRALLEIKQHYPKVILTLGGIRHAHTAIYESFDPVLHSSLRVLPRLDIPAQIREFQNHSVFIFPSLSEGFGLALIEAMSLGLACVTTQTGFGADWIVDQRQAIIVPKASSLHLAIGVCRLLGDNSLRREVASAGHKFAQEFNLKRCARDYIRLFTSGC